MVNVSISALSSVLEYSLGIPISALPVVSNFRNAINKAAPSLESIWDISVLLKLVNSWGEDATLKLGMLALKIVILLRIDCFARSSDLTKLFRSQIVFELNRVKIRFLRPKEWRPLGTHTAGQWSAWVYIHKLQGNQATCTFRTLQTWIRRTEKMAPGIEAEGFSGVPLCIHPEGRNQGSPMSAKRIAQLSLLAMRWAGVDPRYSARSIRAAAASAAKDFGVAEKVILQQGRWSDPKMFRKYYYRPLVRSIKVLRTGSLQEVLRSAI